MPKPLAALSAPILALVLAAAASAQTVVSPAQQVQLLAPQLIPFTGSAGNFESLVNGLTTGAPVTLVTVGNDGTLQVVTFAPGTALTAADTARLLESARQSLIVRGIAAPTGQQIAASLLGGTVATPSGSAVVTGVLTGATTSPTPIQVRTDSAAPGSTPASNISPAQLQEVRNTLATGARLTDFEVNQALQLASTLLAQQGIVNPTPEQLRAALFGGTVRTAGGGSVALQGVLQGRVRNTSDTASIGTSASSTVSTSASPFFGTSNTPAQTPSTATQVPVAGAAAGATVRTAPGGATTSVPRRAGAR